jgi:tRNA nucleotidyltransferase (CCA-adding enzyme)
LFESRPCGILWQHANASGLSGVGDGTGRREVGEPKATAANLAAFAESKVNLPAKIAADKREQVRILRTRLEGKIQDEPGFSLVKMRHAGSVAKGTALRTVNDFDVAVYVRRDDAPDSDDSLLVPWMVDRLRDAYKGLIDPGQVASGAHCATITFKASGTIVDVVPVLYENEANDRGYLVSKDTGDRLLTSVSLHLDFVRARKKRSPGDWAQVIRLVKWWAKQHKDADSSFKFKSFMAELIAAHLLDAGVSFANHQVALDTFFEYVVRTELRERIAFTDFVPMNKVPPRSDASIEILDPVNPDNNVAKRYTDYDRERIVTAAEVALDAITEAKYASTKSQAVECWQIVFGSSFRG